MNQNNKYKQVVSKGLQFVKITFMAKSITSSKVQQIDPLIGIIFDNCIITNRIPKVKDYTINQAKVIDSNKQTCIRTDFNIECNGFALLPFNDSLFPKKKLICQFAEIPENLQSQKYYIFDFPKNNTYINDWEMHQVKLCKTPDNKIVYQSLKGNYGSPIVYIKNNTVNVIGFHELPQDKMRFWFILTGFSKGENDELLIDNLLKSIDKNCRLAINNPGTYQSALDFYFLQSNAHKSSIQKSLRQFKKGSQLIYRSSFNQSLSALDESGKQCITHELETISVKQFEILYKGQLCTFIVELDKQIAEHWEKIMCRNFTFSNLDIQFDNDKLSVVKFTGQDNRTLSLENQLLQLQVKSLFQNYCNPDQQMEELCLELFGYKRFLQFIERKKIQSMIQNFKSQEKKEDAVKQGIQLVRQNSYYCLIKQFQDIIKKMYNHYKSMAINKQDLKKDYHFRYIFGHFQQLLKNVQNKNIKKNYIQFIKSVKKLQDSQLYVKDLTINKPLNKLKDTWLDRQESQQFLALMLQLNIAMHQFLREEQPNHTSTSEYLVGNSVIFKNPEKAHTFKLGDKMEEVQVLDVIACLVQGNRQLQRLKVLHNDLRLQNVIKIGIKDEGYYQIIDLELSLYCCLLDQGQFLPEYKKRLYECNKRVFQFYIKMKKKRPTQTSQNQSIFYAGLDNNQCKLPYDIDYSRNIEEIIGLQLKNHAVYFLYYSPIKLQNCLNTILQRWPNLKKELQNDIGNLSIFNTLSPLHSKQEKYDKLLESIQNLRINSCIRLSTKSQA